MKSGRRRSESSRGLDSLNSFLTLWSLEPRVLARQAGTSSLGSCPRGQQGPQWRVTSCIWAARGHDSSQLRATGLPLSSCCSVVGSVPRPDIQPKTEGQSYKKKMNFFQEPRPSGIPGQGLRDPCRGGPIAHRTPGCSPIEEGCRQGPAVTICVI